MTHSCHIIQLHIYPVYIDTQLYNAFYLDNMLRLNNQAIVRYYITKFNEYLQQDVGARSHLLLCTNVL